MESAKAGSLDGLKKYSKNLRPAPLSLRLADTQNQITFPNEDVSANTETIVVLLCFSQHQVKSTLLPAACKNPCLFAAILFLAATSMNGSRTTAEPGSEILALRQETLSLVRQQLVSPDASGTAEHIMAIQCLAGASFVSNVLLFLLEGLTPPVMRASHTDIKAGVRLRTRRELHHPYECSLNVAQS